jgi:hypothetical protein
MNFSQQDDDRAEEVDDSKPTGFRFQFGISTLLYIMTGLAFLCGLIAWLDIENPEILICSLAAVAVMALTLVTFSPLLRA